MTKTPNQKKGFGSTGSNDSSRPKHYSEPDHGKLAPRVFRSIDRQEAEDRKRTMQGKDPIPPKEPIRKPKYGKSGLEKIKEKYEQMQLKFEKETQENE